MAHLISEDTLIARILRALVPGVFFLGFLGSAALAQSTTQQGLTPLATPTPTAKKYTLPDTFSNQSHPAPTATPKPGSLTVTGKVRGYYFVRLNAVQNASNPNRHALEFAGMPHFDYHLGDTPINLGYTYAGATPFGANGANPASNAHVDNTLPGFNINSPVHEAYVQYKTKYDMVMVGDQELNYPWTPNSDSRVIPASYQGIDSSFQVSDGLTIGLTRIIRFQQRNSSNFEPNTLLTAPYPQTSSLIAKSGTDTPGVLRLAVNYKPLPNVSLSAENYAFYDIANLSYVEGKFGIAPTSTYNPYLAAQFVDEGSLGKNQIGRVDNTTVGAQLGATVTKGLLFTVSTDIAPWHYAIVDATSLAAAEKGFFLPGGGTGAAVAAGPGQYRVAYGGIASPYTDSLGTDPLYTSMITQGMADRRSAGNSYKAAFVYTNPSHQLRLIAGEALFQYSNAISRNLTSEFNADGTYYFNKVRPGPYKGFFVRVRIAPRTIPTLPYNFTYERFITEYDF
jgi:hypothetical protein